jgi:hypothetical protein
MSSISSNSVQFNDTNNLYVHTCFVTVHIAKSLCKLNILETDVFAGKIDTSTDFHNLNLYTFCDMS